MILTTAFWRAAGNRALRTILIAALPVLAPLIGGDWNTTRQALLALALAGVASLATSLVSLPELGGGRTRWHALVDRVARTFGQVVAATIVAGIAWGDVRWADLLVQATVAALGTLLIGLTGTLPEVPDGVPDPLERGDHVTIAATGQHGTVFYAERRTDGWHYGVQLDGTDLVAMYRPDDVT